MRFCGVKRHTTATYRGNLDGKPVTGPHSPVLFFTSLNIVFLQGSKWTPVAYTDCVDPRNVVGFSFNNKLYIVAADAGLPNGAELQFFDKDTGKIYIDHTINSASPTSAAFWRMFVLLHYLLCDT